MSSRLTAMGLPVVSLELFQPEPTHTQPVRALPSLGDPEDGYENTEPTAEMDLFNGPTKAPSIEEYIKRSAEESVKTAAQKTGNEQEFYSTPPNWFILLLFLSALCFVLALPHLGN